MTHEVPVKEPGLQVAPPGEAVATRLVQSGPEAGLLHITTASPGVVDAALAAVGAQARLVTVACPRYYGAGQAL